MKGTIKPKPTGLGAKIAKAAGLVNYQDSSIVSREIVKKPTCNVTIFAFDEGQGLSGHTAPFDALGHVLEGDVENQHRRQTASLAGRRDDSLARASAARSQGTEALQDER